MLCSGVGAEACSFTIATEEFEDDAFVNDPLLDPLDLALRDDYLYVTSAFSFGADDALVLAASLDARNGASCGIWSAEVTPAFGRVQRPRGITFTDDGTLLMCAQNCVLAVESPKPSGARRWWPRMERLARPVVGHWTSLNCRGQRRGLTHRADCLVLCGQPC